MSHPGGELRRMRSLIADLDGIVWEADARTMLFTFVSSGCAPILGYAPKEWLSDPTFWADRIHADDRERVIAQFVRAATAGWSFDAEYRFMAKDGSIVWLRDVGHVVRDPESAWWRTSGGAPRSGSEPSSSVSPRSSTWRRSRKVRAPRARCST
jgi:PAS domain-containing protein